MKKFLTLIVLFSASHANADNIMTNMPEEIKQNLSAVRLCVTVISEAHAKSTCETPVDIGIAAKSACNQMFVDLSSAIASYPFSNSLIDTSNVNGKKTLTSAFDVFLNREITTKVVESRAAAKNCN